MLTLIWLLVGFSIGSMGFKILFLNNTKMIKSLKYYSYKNEERFIIRHGLIAFVFGLLIIASTILSIIKSNTFVTTITMFNEKRTLGFMIFPIVIGTIYLIISTLNQALSVSLRKEK